MTSPDDHRRSERLPVGMQADCRTDTGLSGRVEIVDLTAEGCRIFSRGMPLRAEQRVRIKPVNFQTIPGIVRWVATGYAGIQFDSVLYGPVAEHLQRTIARSQE